MSDIKDISLAPSGHDKIEWVRSYMPVLNQEKNSKTTLFAFTASVTLLTIYKQITSLVPLGEE